MSLTTLACGPLDQICSIYIAVHEILRRPSVQLQPIVPDTAYNIGDVTVLDDYSRPKHLPILLELPAP